MKKYLTISGVVVGVVVLAFVGYSYHVSQPIFDGLRGEFQPEIADPNLALTFARTESGLILVREHEGDALKGINLTSLFGTDRTEDFIEFVANERESLEGLTGELERFSLDALIKPLSFAHPSVAAGTNFKEHADEIYSDDPPFLFPKLTEPGEWNESVPFLPRLDYEAELCMFPLQDIDDPNSLPTFGLVLCNDFTDRLTLISELDLGVPLGQTGFASGKGCDRCFPTGYLVVVPNSPDFYLSLKLALFVNDRPRQQFSMDAVILPIEELITQSFASREIDYKRGDDSVTLLPSDRIPRGTLILTGTAAGVMFRPENIWNQAFYLQAGDVVRTEATFLGHLENLVEELE